MKFSHVPVCANAARVLTLALGVSSLGGCAPGSTANGPTGDLAFFVSAEESITGGLEAGTGDENIVDGWSVTFERYLITLGRITAIRRATGASALGTTVWVVDLAAAPATGLPLVTYPDLEVGVYDDVRFELSRPTADAVRDDSVTPALFSEMIAGGCTYLIEGALTSPTGTSTPPGGASRPAPTLAFRLCVPAPIRVGPCSTPDGMEGVVVTEGALASTSLTIHGDHPFFNALPGGAEVVTRRAQWLANSDLDGDGAVTEAELTAIAASALFRAPDYSLAGSPVPIESAWDFLRAQLMTQAHLNGEGECPLE